MDTSFARPWLRLEGLALLAAAAAAYHHFALPWGWFALFLLAPDLSMLGYLAGPRVGALAYNLAHTTPPALALAVAGLVGESRPALGAGLVWCAHLGLDRALGYGLKSAASFRDTHLGRVGHDRPAR
jgi:hypothetical protein